MISVESTPSLVSLLGNPIRFKLKSDTVVATPGVPASMTLTFPDRGYEANSDAFTLYWGVISVRFACMLTHWFISCYGTCVLLY